MNTSSKTPGLFRRLTYKIPIFRSLTDLQLEVVPGLLELQ